MQAVENLSLRVACRYPSILPFKHEKILAAGLVSGLTLLAPVVRAQAATVVPIAYSEKVSVENSNPTALYHRALSWTESHFPYAPTTDLQASEESREIRLTGTSKIKLATTNASGPEQMRDLRFTFAFCLTD